MSVTSFASDNSQAGSNSRSTVESQAKRMRYLDVEFSSEQGTLFLAWLHVLLLTSLRNNPVQKDV
jgi:hypothetical protein